MSNLGTTTVTLSYENGTFVGRFSKVSNNGEMSSGSLPETAAGQLAAMMFPSQVAQVAAAAATTGSTTTTTTTSTVATNLTTSIANLKVTL